MEWPNSRLFMAALLLERFRARPWQRAVESGYARRQQRMLWASALGLGLSLLPWFLFFSWRADWGAAGLYAIGLGLVALQALLIRQGRALAASLVLSVTGWLAISLVALWIDQPSAGSPRSVLLFCLPLFLVQRFLLQEQPRWLRDGVQGVSLGLLVLWASLPDLAPGTPPLGPELQRGGAIFNVAAAALLSAWVLHLEEAELRAHKGLALELARAIASGELRLALQPQCDAQGRVLGVEALLRWSHPRRGELSPGEILPLARAEGLLLPLGDWALREACRLLQSWHQQPELRELPLALNLSPAQLHDGTAFERLLAQVERAGLAPGRLVFEVTEAVFAEQAERVRERLLRCRKLGIATALDDFGTGYSSLAYLTELPFDQLKLDASFVRGLGRDARCLRIAETVLSLGQRLGMQVVAEGVETGAQREQLLALGCTAFQGRWLAAPMPAAELPAWLARQAARAEPQAAA